MTEGDTHYLEIYFMSTTGSSFFKFSAQIPNNNAGLLNTVPAVQKITVTPITDP